jgi:3-oxoacyl-[acyl-carrier protein] reductase
MEERIAVVTGGSRGIGKAIALRLAQEKTKVIITCQKGKEAAQAVVKEITSQGGKARAYQFDVADFGQTQRNFEEILAKFGKIDYLINNAGTTKDALLLRMKEEDWDKVIAVNLKGAFNCIKAVIKPMFKQGFGRIINITSVTAFMGNIGQANYIASKAGLVGLTKALAKELAPRGVTVNAVAPGFIETDMTATLSERIRKYMLTIIPLARFGKPEEVAEVVAFLASPKAAYITGEVIHINGGMFV